MQSDSSSYITECPTEAQQFCHGSPSEGMMCLCTMEDITEETGNYVEYQCVPSMQWKPSLFEACVVEQLLEKQFHQYVEKVKKTDCQAELRRLLAPPGPPIYISDKHGLPLDEGDEYVIRLWFASNNRECSAKLQGALEGEERDRLWESLKEFLVEDAEEEQLLEKSNVVQTNESTNDTTDEISKC